jgi:hypothetical protein
MSDTMLADKFEKLGAQLKLGPLDSGDLRLDVRSDRAGKFFDLRLNPGPRFSCMVHVAARFSSPAVYFLGRSPCHSTTPL